MDRGKLKEHLEIGKTKIRTTRAQVEQLEEQRASLNGLIDDARDEERRAVSADSAEAYLSTLEGVPSVELELFRTMIAGGDFSHNGESAIGRIESFNDTLEAWRELLCGGPHLVVGKYPGSIYPDRGVQIVLTGEGNMTSPHIVQYDTGFYFEDYYGKRAALYDRRSSLTRLLPSPRLSQLHRSRTDPALWMSVITGEDAIIEKVQEIKDEDITAFFDVVRQTHGFIIYPESVLQLAPEQVEAITEGIAQCIAVASLQNMRSDAIDHGLIRESVFGDRTVANEYQQYLQLTDYYLNQSDFYFAMEYIFGEAFKRETLLSRAFDIQNERISQVLRIITPLGTIGVTAEKGTWPNGVEHILVPTPKVSHSGLS